MFPFDDVIMMMLILLPLVALQAVVLTNIGAAVDGKIGVMIGHMVQCNKELSHINIREIMGYCPYGIRNSNMQ